MDFVLQPALPERVHCCGAGALPGSARPALAGSVFSGPFRAVSAQGVGCRNESGLLAAFYHLMMAIHRLLGCSRGNGSCFRARSPATLRSLLPQTERETWGSAAGRAAGRPPPLGKAGSFAGGGGTERGGLCTEPSAAPTPGPARPWQGRGCAAGSAAPAPRPSSGTGEGCEPRAQKTSPARRRWLFQ